MIQDFKKFNESTYSDVVNSLRRYLNELPTGIYFCHIRTGKGNTVAKIIKH